MSRPLSDFTLLIPGGGSSVRFGSGNKLLQDLNGLPVFLHAIRMLYPLFGGVLMAVPADQIPAFQQLAQTHLPDMTIGFIPGGSSRMESVWNLAEAAAEMKSEYIAVHDAARPLIRIEPVLACGEICRKTGAALLCHRITDTLKRGADGMVAETVARENMYGAETPQMFRLDLFLPAIRRAVTEHWNCTDDVQVMELVGHSATIVENQTLNPKITHSADLDFCRAVVR